MISRPTPPIATDERGTVFVEFLVVIVSVWTLALSAFQLTLVAAANLVVKHAADSAARSASVVLPDDPAAYGDEAKARANDPLFPDSGRSRLETVELAAQVPLIPFSAVGTGFSLRQAIPSMRALGPALLRQSSQVAVAVAGVEEENVSAHEATVRVTFAFECLVPVARRLLCAGRDALQGAPVRLPISFESFPVSSTRRFRVLTHRTTLLIQAAPYQYLSRGS